MNDGAAAVVIASRAYAEKNNLKPIAQLLATRRRLWSQNISLPLLHMPFQSYLRKSVGH
jgi:acetyl-CoA acetyltransferase